MKQQLHLYTIFLLGLTLMFGFTGPLPAQTPDLPAWYTQQPLNISRQACFDRAVQALQASSLTNMQTQDGWTASATSANLRGGIVCLQSGNGTFVGVNVAGAAGHAGEANRMLNLLRDYMLNGVVSGTGSGTNQPSSSIQAGTYDGSGWGTVVLQATSTGFTGTYTGTYSRTPGQITLVRQGSQWRGTWGESAIGRGGELYDIVVSPDGRTISGQRNVTSRGSRGGTSSGSFRWVLQQAAVSDQLPPDVPYRQLAAPVQAGTYDGSGWGTVVLQATSTGFTGTYTGTYSRTPGQITLVRQGSQWRGTWGESAIGRGGELYDIVVSPDGRTISGQRNVTSRGSRGGTSSGSFRWVLK